jgi:Zn-dependent membrane protease YugP
MHVNYILVFLIILFTVPTQAQFSIAPVYGYSMINATEKKTGLKIITHTLFMERISV